MYGGNDTLKARGALSIGVPGEIAGLYEAWKRHGKLPWKELVMPAAKLAWAFTVSPYLHMQMKATEAGILGNAGMRAVYACNGEILKVGDVCRNGKLAWTLEAVAERGPAAFYSGPVADLLVKDVEEAGGIMTKEDLEHYQVKVRRPLSQNVMGLTVLSMPPPSAGGAGLMLVSFLYVQIFVHCFSFQYTEIFWLEFHALLLYVVLTMDRDIGCFFFFLNSQLE